MSGDGLVDFRNPGQLQAWEGSKGARFGFLLCRAA